MIEQNGLLRRLVAILGSNSRVAFGAKKAKTADVAERLPPWPVPDGKEIVIKAPLSNAGTVYLGTSKPEAEDTNTAYPLTPGASITYRIKDLSQIWFMSDTVSEGVAWTVERDDRN